MDSFELSARLDEDETRHAWHRFLSSGGGGEGPAHVDYTALSVLVITLGLIMLVEAVRHWLESLATNRPLFKAVLTGVYAECTFRTCVCVCVCHLVYELFLIRIVIVCIRHIFLVSTLGVVELFIYLLHTYYAGLGLAQENLFVQVHFSLFYTALFNAIHSVIVAAYATRLSRKHWVKTETLELNHYVEIREEFQLVTDQLEKVRRDRGGIWGGASNFMFGVVASIRYPALRRKYHGLLMQIRFHELRVHFLQAYNLPIKLKISDYLMRSEMNVLIGLVNVSLTAWLLLTGAANILWLVMGIILYETQNGDIVGRCLTWIFFTSMALFVIMAIVMHNKMDRIFKAIMKEKQLWDLNESIDKKLADQQKQLFWFSDPKVVIAAIQFMQFGYAVALSIVIIFYSTLLDGTVRIVWYFLVIGVSYSIFVYVVGMIIPRYTLCTSMGQLVDMRRLHETVSNYHLQEAILEQLELKDFQASNDLAIEKVRGSQEPDPLFSGSLIPPYESNASRVNDGKLLSNVRGRKDMTKDMETAELMAELVKTDTASLRDTLPASEREALDARKQNRANRKKSNSEGVGAMAAIGLTSRHRQQLKDMFGGLVSATRDDSSLPRSALTPEWSRAGFNYKADGPDNLSTSPDLPIVGLSKEDTTPAGLQALRKSRSRRRKTVSDGVALMSRRTSGIEWTQSFSSVQENQQTINQNASGLLSDDNVSSRDPITVPPVHLEKALTKPVLSQSLASQLPTSDARDRKLGSSGMASEVHDHDQLFLSAWTKQPISPHDSTGHGGIGTERPFGESVSNHQSHLAPFLQLSTLHCKDASSDTDDKNSIASEAATTDVDDPPLIDPLKLLTENPPIPLRERIRTFYLSETFRTMSSVIGTMLAFFFVGERVAGFLRVEGISNEQDFVFFAFETMASFWVLYGLFICFLLNVCILFYAMAPFNLLETNKERMTLIGGVLDLIICVGCLVVMTIAENRRCCNPGIDGGNPSTNSSAAVVLDPTECNCLAFGSRVFGGLGSIEPYTALVSLRVFRFWTANRIVLYFKETVSKESQSAEVTENRSEDEAEASKTPLLMTDERGTTVELWEVAVGKYPDIVAEYGEFSGELLRAMLGISNFLPQFKDNAARDEGLPDQTAAKEYTIQKKYAGLNIHAQEIIMAGALGSRVRTVSQQLTGDAVDTIYENEISNDGKSLTFEIDTTPMETLNSHYHFAAPTARLVKSMRRCDKKLLPMQDKWTGVDVLITRFEIVYLSASDVDATELGDVVDDTRQALIATKGGKGLRLCDVAVGRQVLGILPLSDVDSVFVEREMPHLSIPGRTDGPSFETVQHEYWIPAEKGDFVSRNSSWCSVKQDILKIHSVHGGTLKLRFYSDLEDSKAHSERWITENEAEGPIFKNNAFQWAQAIIRYCGPEQLRQPLPHFGDDTSDELRDFLLVHRKETRGPPNRHSSIFIPRHSRSARGDMASSLRVFTRSNSDVMRPGQIATNLAEGEVDSMQRRPSKFQFRSSSMGERFGSFRARSGGSRRASEPARSIKGSTNGLSPLSAKEKSEDEAFFGIVEEEEDEVEVSDVV
jgi:hypothetical protein